MKLSAIFFVTAFTGVIATPVADGSALEARATCYHPSSCSWTNSGRCEGYCSDRGHTYTFMSSSGCTLNSKKCCCTA